jgi:thiol-disulfide isomerase/thioredoxin
MDARPPSGRPSADWTAPGAAIRRGPLPSVRPKRAPSLWGVLTLVAAAAVGVAWWAWPVTFPRLALVPAASNHLAGDACEGRERCVVVYMAPWCGACKSAFPIIRNMARRWASGALAVKPIIGLASTAQCEQMAQTLGVPAYLDPSGKLLRAAGAQGVPQWFVLNRAGRVKKRFSGVVLDVDRQIERLWLARPNRLR